MSLLHTTCKSILDTHIADELDEARRRQSSTKRKSQEGSDDSSDDNENHDTIAHNVAATKPQKPKRSRSLSNSSSTKVEKDSDRGSERSEEPLTKRDTVKQGEHLDLSHSDDPGEDESDFEGNGDADMNSSDSSNSGGQYECTLSDCSRTFATSDEFTAHMYNDHDNADFEDDPDFD